MEVETESFIPNKSGTRVTTDIKNAEVSQSAGFHVPSSCDPCTLSDRAL